MYIDGHMLTKPTMDRLSPGPLGVRVSKWDKCYEGYTLFSSAFGESGRCVAQEKTLALAD